MLAIPLFAFLATAQAAVLPSSKEADYQYNDNMIINSQVNNQDLQQANVGAIPAPYSPQPTIGQTLGLYTEYATEVPLPSIGQTIGTLPYDYSYIGSTDASPKGTAQPSAAKQTASISPKKSASSTAKPSPSSDPKPDVLSCYGDDLLFLFNVYSQIKSAKISDSKLLPHASISSSPFTLDFFKGVALAAQPNATAAQKKLVSNVKDYGSLSKVQSALFNVGGGFQAPFNVDQVLYQKVKTYRGAYEVMNAELPSIIKSTPSKDRMKFIKDLSGFANNISKCRYKVFKDAVSSTSATQILKDNGIEFSDSLNYIKFTSSSKVKNIDDAIKNVNNSLKKGSKATFTSDMIHDAQIATEVMNRLYELVENASSAT